MTSITSAAEDLGWFDRSFQVKASTIDTYVSDLEAAFGSSQSDLIDIDCKPVKGQQKITFREEDNTMQVTFLLEAHVKNPLKKEFDAVAVTLEIDAVIKLLVNDDYLLTGRLKDIDMSVHDFKPYFHTHTTKEKLES